MIMVTQELLKQHFIYYPETGLIQKLTYRGKQKLGDLTPGNLGVNGYYTLFLNGENHLVHRIAFLYMLGTIPKEVDHLDCNKRNNKWDNLRECSHVQNMANSNIRNTNSTGIKGLSFEERHNRYVAYIGINFKTVKKHFPIKDKIKGEVEKEAITWLQETRLILHNEFARN